MPSRWSNVHSCQCQGGSRKWDFRWWKDATYTPPAVNVAADIRHDVDFPIRVPHVLSRKKERRPSAQKCPAMNVRGMSIPREGVKFQRIRHEIVHAERSPTGARRSPRRPSA